LAFCGKSNPEVAVKKTLSVVEDLKENTLGLAWPKKNPFLTDHLTEILHRNL